MLVKVGDKYLSNRYGEYEVIEYTNSRHVLVKFLETGYNLVTTSYCAKIGRVRDNLATTHSGVGVYDSPTKVDHKAYKLWADMLRCCYVNRGRTRDISYIDCTVSKNFKRFSYFQDWCLKQKGFNTENFSLDKDLLVKGNKIYSEDTCCFLPAHINNSLTTTKSKRGDYPIGVTLHKPTQKFLTACTMYGKRKHLGLYYTIEGAFNRYKETKEAYLKELAKKYMDEIDIKAYDALMNYKVEITD